MKLKLLRYLFLTDGAVLALLGALLIFAPKQIEAAFGFRDLPQAVNYLVGLWGCGLGTLAIGYVVAAANPVRHGLGIILAAVMTIAYLALYPRKPRVAGEVEARQAGAVA